MPSNTLQPLQQDPQYVAENLPRGMDFTPRLSITGDTLTGTPVVTVSVMAGSDPNPSAIRVGSPTLSSNNMQVIQRVSGGVSGTAYILSFQCATEQGNTVKDQAFFWVV
jgi:hypothetical protein